MGKAQLLLLGSFARHGDALTVQVRLIRVSDQQILTQVTWTDEFKKVLSAPQALSEQLQASLGHAVDPGKLRGLEQLIPTTIDVAESYYGGVRSFDGGRYPEALAHYLDASQPDTDFRKAPAAVLEMYYLLGRSEHAVLFARELGRIAEQKGLARDAVEYYFAAARESMDPLRDPKAAADLLQQALRVVDRQERRTRDIATAKRAILRRIDVLGSAGKEGLEKLVSDREIRDRVWVADIDSELERRAEEQARGGYAGFDNGRWVKRSAPEISMLMWRIRTRRTLAQAYARLRDIGAALDQYRDLLDEYEFLAAHLPLRLVDSIKTEAHFMMLRHHAETGQLIRHHPVNRINRLNIVNSGDVFRRDFHNDRAQRTSALGPRDAPDARARVASRAVGQGHEYFDFAAPPGQQIDSLTLRVEVRGIAEFAVSLPQPVGWPPQISFSKRLEHMKYSTAGHYERRIVPPRGTEFLSVGTSWGPGLYSNTLAEVMQHALSGIGNGPNIVKWELSFAVSRKVAVRAATPSSVATPPSPAVRSLLDRYAAGWERGEIVRGQNARMYSGEPPLDVYAEEWLVYAMNNDIRIFHQKDLGLEIELPVAINSREREFDASLVRTHDGRYALLWARGTSPTTARRFIAFSADLRRWETPHRLAFEEARGPIGYTYALAEPLERTYNVAAIKGAYLMLLAQGFVRRSEDLRTWGPPRKTLPQDLHRNRLLKGADGAVWAVFETSSPERQPYTTEDWLHGFFVTDGKAYRHLTELKVSRSIDGAVWQDAGKVVVPGQPSALWAFAVDDRRIGIAAGFNNLFVKWFTAASLGELDPIDSDLQLFDQSGEAAFFVHDGALTCVRPIFSVESQTPLLLATTTERVFKGAVKP